MRSGSSARLGTFSGSGVYGWGVQQISSQSVEERVHACEHRTRVMAAHLHLHLRLPGKDRPRVLLVERTLFDIACADRPFWGPIEPLEPIGGGEALFVVCALRRLPGR